MSSPKCIFINIYFFKGNCIIIFWHVMYINFVEDKPWILYVLDNYFEFIYRLLYVLICKTKYFRTNIIQGKRQNFKVKDKCFSVGNNSQKYVFNSIYFIKLRNIF